MPPKRHDGQQVDNKQVDAGLLLAGATDAARLAGLVVSFRDFLGRDTDFLLSCVGDRAIGYAQLRHCLSLWCSGIEAQVDDLFVDTAARGRGVGLTTNERDAEALRPYQRAGFAAERPRWDGGRQLWLELEPQQVDERTS